MVVSIIEKLFIRYSIVGIFLLGNTFSSTQAQEIKEGGAYLNYIGTQYRGISQDFVSYVSAVAHGKSARKVAKRRETLLNTNKDAIQKVSFMQDFKGDKSLRDSAKNYLQISYHVLNEDYGKIMDLEVISEQSYDAMEAYILAQEVASQKIKQASKSLKRTEKDFCLKYNINLVEAEDELSKKMDKIALVNDYYQPIYLIFFKTYKQEMYLIDAFQNKNISSIEQNNNTLLANSKEALEKLITKSSFEGDDELLSANKQLQEFYKEECQQIPLLTKFFLQEENFNKIKKAFESKKDNERTKADVDEFNKEVASINKASHQYNQMNSKLFEKRNLLIEHWNVASSNFLDKHTPK